jgi:hypothetical protein
MTPIGIPARPADSKKRTWVFNPPPGWPAPPEKWEPEAGWLPDPVWPSPPPGWEFWRPVSRRPRRGPTFYVKAAAGVLTFAATITGTYLAFKGQPTTFTAASWERQANAACDQDAGALNLSIFNGLAPSAATQGGTSVQASFASKVSAFVSATGNLSKVVGDLAALQTPKDGHEVQVEAVISSGNGLVNNMNTLSNALTAVVDQSSSVATILPQVITDMRRVTSSVVIWQKAIKPLNLRQCPFWVNNPNLTPTAVPTVPSTPASSLTAGEQQLTSRLNQSILAGCTGDPALEGNGIAAAVYCRTVAAGPTQQPLIVQFADSSSAQRWFANNTAGFTRGSSCADGQWLGTWNHNNVVAGMLGCTYTNNGLRIVWGIDNALIGMTAYGSDSAAMYQWWTNSAYLITS